LSAAAISAAAGIAHELRARNAVPVKQPGNDSAGPVDPEGRGLIRGTIQYFLVPVWLAAGIADWWCHKRSRIETTAGTKESLIHLLLLGEAAVPAVLGLFLEINPLLLSAMIALFFAHDATVIWDVDYAMRRREVTPLEQHVHSVLELAPLGALMLLSLLHWPQFKAVLGLATVAPSTIRLKREPLSRAYIVADLAAMGLLGLLPYVEELRRDLRTRRSDRLPDRPIARRRPISTPSYR
jgi:hypothetical protein